MVDEQLPHPGRGVGEGVLVGGEDLGGGEAADAFEGVEVVAERVGDGGVVGVLVQADVRGDLRQQVVAGEEASAARESSGVVLLEVETDVAGGVARGPDRAQTAAGEVEELAGDDLAVRQGGRQPGEGRRWSGGLRSGAMCPLGAPAAASLAAMYVYQRSGRVSRVRRTIEASAACIATHAPEASRTWPDRPWWSGWWCVITTAATSPTEVPHAVSPAVRASQEAGSSQPVSIRTGPRSVSTT